MQPPRRPPLGASQDEWDRYAGYSARYGDAMAAKSEQAERNQEGSIYRAQLERMGAEYRQKNSGGRSLRRVRTRE